ncbi:hypothetical protein R6Q57_005113 [Mikania cordata]
MRAPLGVAAPSPPRGRAGTPPPCERPPPKPPQRPPPKPSQRPPNFYAQLQQNPNFQHFQPPPNFQPGFAVFSQPRFESDFVSPSQPENEVVPETQDTLKRKKRKKNKQPVGAGPSSGPMAPKQWTPDEETALGRCFMNESENKTKGNSEKRENFWKKVTVSWHRVMGFDAEYRTYHQLNSKWKDMCTKLTKFSGIYSNCANNRKSGMNDENVLKWTDKEYQLKSNGQTFNHYHVWVAIKDSPKFRVLCEEGYEVQVSSKRTKNSESNEYSPGVLPHIQITRLTSRMTKKKNPSSTPHRNRLDRWVEIKQNRLPLRVVKPATLSRQQPSSPINSKLSRLFKNKNTKIENKYTKIEKKMHEEKQLRADLRAMELMPPELLDDADREIMRKMKNKLLDKYR